MFKVIFKSTSLLILLSIFFARASNAQWEPTSGPSLGHVNGFYQYHDTIYAAIGQSSSGSVLRSTDSGKSWEWLNYHLPFSFPVDAIIRDSTTIFIGTRNGLYTTSNEGKTWNVSVPGATVKAFAKYHGAIYVTGLNRQLMFSSDHGASWTNVVSSSLPNNVAVNTIFANGDDLYLGTNGEGVFRTRDSGKTWDSIASIIPKSEAYITCVTKIDTVLSISTIRNLYRSTDGGSTWNRSSTGFPADNGPSALEYNGNVMFAGVPGYGLYISKNLGLTWKKSPASSEYFIPSAFTTFGRAVIEGSLGIFRSSDDGNSWEESDNGVASTTITSLVATQSDILAGDLDADFGLVWRTTDKGVQWDTSATGLSTIGVNSLVRCGSNLLAGLDGSGVFYSTDDGHTWDTASGMPFSGYVLCMSSMGNIAIAGLNNSEQNLFRSTDGGVHWLPVSSALPFGLPSAILTDGTTFMASVTGNGFFESKDSGKSWSTLASPVVGSPELIGVAGSIIFASDGGKNLYRSEDHGASWQLLSFNLPSSRPLSVVSVGTVLYLGTSQGILQSPDSGSTWIKDTSQMQNFAIASLLYANGALYAGTTGGGVWTLSIEAATVQASNVQDRTSFQAWPNPVNRSCTISYSLPTSGTTMVKLVDESGRIVQQVNLGYRAAGTHSYSLDCEAVSDGNYTLQLLYGNGNSSNSRIIVHH